jgi:hypothetical protein
VPRRRRTRAVTSPARYEALTPRELRRYKRARNAAAEFRAGMPLSRAARKHKTTVGTIERYLGVEFPLAGGRRRPVGDRAGALFNVLGTDGPREMLVFGSRQRSLLGRHGSAIERLSHDGGDALFELGEVTVTGIDATSGQRVLVVLEVDPDTVAYWQQREPEFFREIYKDTV